MKNFALVSLLLIFSNLSFAGLQISPIQLYLDEKMNQRSVTVVMESKDIKTEKIFEMSAVKWTQDENGIDQYENVGDDLIINPKNFVILPGKKQIVRIGFTQPIRAMNLTDEQTYRITFKEVAPVVKASTMNFLFNISLPLFLGKQDNVNIKITTQYSNNHLSLNIKNNALSHIQILKITIVDNHGKKVLENNDMKYLLKGSNWVFNLGQINLSDFKRYKAIIETDKMKNGIPLEYQLGG